MRQAYQDKWKYGRCISAIWWVTWRAFTWSQRGGKSANHFFTEISRDFACPKKVCFNKFRPFPGSCTRHIANISLKDLTTYGNHAIRILFYKRDIERWKSPKNISFEQEYLKNFQNYKYTHRRQTWKFCLLTKILLNNC